MRASSLALLLLVPTCVAAGPSWQTLEGVLPEKSSALFSLSLNDEVRGTVTEALPFDPAILGRVLKEHFGDFATAAGLDVARASELFGGVALAAADKGQAPSGLVGLKAPLETRKVAAALKGSPLPGQGWTLNETPEAVTMIRGQAAVAFTAGGLVLVGRADQVGAALNRKGAAAPSNASLVGTARARSGGDVSLVLVAHLPPGSMPPLDHPSLKAHDVDPRILTGMTSVTVATGGEGLAIHAEFSDSAAPARIASLATEGMKKWQARAASDMAAAEGSAAKWGVLASMVPEVWSARMAVELAAYGASKLSVQADGKALAVRVPRDVLAALKGTAGLTAVAIAGAAIVGPALQLPPGFPGPGGAGVGAGGFPLSIPTGGSGGGSPGAPAVEGSPAPAAPPDR
jgi:hypothetical protein